VVPRKGIEHAIGLIAALNDPLCKLVVSHESGDEGDEYLHALQEMADHQGVDLYLVADRISELRGTDEQGRPLYTLEDAYQAADFITYPSIYEGFGNALIESFFYRKPVLVNRYSIFVTDIEPKGFQVITMNGYLTKDVVARVGQIIHDHDYRTSVVDNNYDLGRRFFSYSVLRRKLRTLITNHTGMDDL
jgi:glycosyltransferase involved in cell wall biosynthesis